VVQRPWACALTEVGAETSMTSVGQDTSIRSMQLDVSKLTMEKGKELGSNAVVTTIASNASKPTVVERERKRVVAIGM
jgi:hypothetical protein